MVVDVMLPTIGDPPSHLSLYCINVCHDLLSLSFPCIFIQMSSEIETPCTRILSLADYCRRGQPFCLLLGSLPLLILVRSVAIVHVNGEHWLTGELHGLNILSYPRDC